MNSLKKNTANQIFLKKISLEDIISNLLKNFVNIAIFGIFGLFIGVIFLFFAEEKFEAKAYVKVAQIKIGKNFEDPRGNNLEDPSQLIVRMKMPTNYKTDTIENCSLINNENLQQQLSEKISFSLVKGAPSLLEIAVRDTSKKSAYTCINAVFLLVKDTQKLILKPILNQAEIRRKEYEKLIDENLKILSMHNGYELDSIKNIIISRDKVNLYLEELINIKLFIDSSDLFETQLISPIYVIDKPVYPKKFMVLIISFLAGFLLGFVGITLYFIYKCREVKNF